jgi:hypothetical protein
MNCIDVMLVANVYLCVEQDGNSGAKIENHPHMIG